MTFRPLFNAVLVRPLWNEKIGSLYVPDVAQPDKPKRGLVLATGDDKVWLFCQGYPEGVVGNHNCFCNTGLQHPVEKKRLVDAVRRALSAGMNIDMRRDPPLVYTERFTLSHMEVVREKDATPPPMPDDVPPPPRRMQ